MTPKIFKNYGSSDHIIELQTFLSHLEQSEGKTLQMAVQVWDYIMMTLTYANALRASNLIEMTLKDINTA